MAVDSPAVVLDDAWGHIPQTRENTAGIGSFTRTRVERIISLMAGIAFLVFGTQSFLAALGPAAEREGWHIPLVIAVFAPLALTIAACLVGRGVKIAAGVFAVVYVVALLLWPVATAGMPTTPADVPWIWFLVNVGTMSAALAFPFPLQIVWTIVTPALYGLARLIQAGFAHEFWFGVGLDVVFALILGGVLFSLAWLFRSMAANVDATRARAVDSYAFAAATEAAEQERIAVAALMHDSVLAALIAAERADTPRAKTLAVAMAREALTRLANTEHVTGEGSDDPWTPEVIAQHIEADARELGVKTGVTREIADDAVAVPGRAARALGLAATQAVSNALQHAGGVGLVILVAATADGVRIEVHDDGAGFDLDAVPDDRLGIRASIVARVAAVGGSVDIESGASGTTVRLEWRGETP